MKYTDKAFPRFMRRMLLFAASPAVFAMLVALLRTLRAVHRKMGSETKAIRRIMVSHPYSSIGDLVLLVPLLERIREEWPDAIADIVVGGRSADLLRGVSGLNVLPLEGCDPFQEGLAQKWLGFGAVVLRYLIIFRLILFSRRILRQYDYDLAVVPRWGSLETWPAIYLAYLTGARMIVAYSASVDGGPRDSDVLLTHSPAGGENEHETQRNLSLLCRAGIWKASQDQGYAVNRPVTSLIRLAQMSENSTDLGSLFPRAAVLFQSAYGIVSPGATASLRIWPAEQLIQVIQSLHKQMGLKFCLVGRSQDTKLCEQIAGALPECVVSLAGRTGLPELVRILSGAQLFIGMDSGTAHLAGALGIPTVVLSPFPASCTIEHVNSPVRFRPCGPRVRVLQPQYPQPPCDPTCSQPAAHCIQQIRPDDVVLAAEQITAGMANSEKAQA